MTRSLPVLLVLLSATTAAVPVDHQHTWRSLPAIDTYTAPAVSAHPDPGDGSLRVAAVAATGVVAVTSALLPDGWLPWMILGPAPCPPFLCGFYANSSTPPVLVAHGNTLYLFVRGVDDNLYVIRKVGTAAWEADWQPVTAAQRVRGQFSVTFTQGLAGPPEVHVLYETGPGRIEVRHLSLGWTDVGTPRIWPGVHQGTLASDGQGQVLVVLRSLEASELLVHTKSWPWTSPWEEEAVVAARGPLGEFHDISNPVYFAHAFHVAFSHRYLCDDVSGTYCDELAHLLIPRGQPPAITIRQIAPYVPSGGSHALSTLQLYRNKLVAAWTDPGGEVRASRLDTADPDLPWVGGEVVDAGHGTVHRPALGVLDRRPSLSLPDYGMPNFGNDLFAVMAEQADDSVSYVNVSRAVLLRDATRQLTFWESNENMPKPCRKIPADADLITEPFTDGRPVFTEVGFNLWMFPDWLSSHLFQDAGRRGCLAGSPSGRFYPPCDDARYPVIFRPVDEIGICDGVWIGEMNNYLRAWSEFGHSLAGMFGLHDRDQDLPSQQDADESGIPLPALTAAHQIFGESLGTNCPLGSDPNPPHAGRCRGFTGISWNYDANSRQHSFMYAVQFYIQDGDMLRDWIARDEVLGIDLLRRKYDWIRQHIFRGVEFHLHSDPVDPWNVDCTPERPLACDGLLAGDTQGAPRRTSSNPCSPYDYSGPETAHRVRVPFPMDVTVLLAGLAQDLDLFLLAPGTAECDSSTCIQASTNTGTFPESLTFHAVPGATYYLLVDGYAGAESVYTMQVTCALGPIGEVPGAGNPLRVEYVPGAAELDLFWDTACGGAGEDYAVYAGSLGEFYTHDALVCSTGSATWHRLPMPEGDVYFLVAAHNGLREGSHGWTSGGEPRPQGMSSCLGSVLLDTCP